MLYRTQKWMVGLLALVGLVACQGVETVGIDRDPVDYVNPYIGNISHLLVPTYPTVHLPNSFLRVYPERDDYTSDRLTGLPLVVTSHRGSSAFNLTPYQGEEKNLRPVMPLSYDQEQITPYRYQVYLDEAQIAVDYAPSHQSAVYRLMMEQSDKPTYLVFNSRRGELSWNGEAVSGFQFVDRGTKVYIYAVPDKEPDVVGVLVDGVVLSQQQNAMGRDAALALYFSPTKTLGIRYGISFISENQAKENLMREIKGFDVEAVAREGRAVWNETLGKIRVEGGTEEDRTIFYTSLYRCFERPVCLSEGGRYYSAFDGQVHEDGGRAFYTDDWLWDTYRATHPLRILMDPARESDILYSFMRMTEQMENPWMPTFPEVTGDSRRMNSNHGIATLIDGWRKGVRGFDLEQAFQVSRAGVEDKTLIPWSGASSGWLDAFYRKHGYIPALRPGEQETVENVSDWEKRQPVAVTLGTAYDEWCISQLALELGKTDEAAYYLRQSYNYRTLFNPATFFFHPKDKDGQFIEGIDYRYSGGLGARDYYDENNGYIYQWDVQHNVADLIALHGGNEAFVHHLDTMFETPLGMSKWQFYAILPDHTGNVGQFSMANEPSFHIPYLYNYAGQPWKTQKRIRTLLNQWYRNDLMGVPGDEDGGGMSAFVAFSMMGIYPVTPGMPVYNIGSPCFSRVTIDMGEGKQFTIVADDASAKNKYIQSATLDGTVWNQPWLDHAALTSGSTLHVKMGAKANQSWGIQTPPPSADPFIEVQN